MSVPPETTLGAPTKPLTGVSAGHDLIVSLVPSMVAALGSTPAYGLASTDEVQRKRALADVGRACDLAVAWTLMTAEGRDAFRDRLQVEDSDWARGRGWALWKTVATCWHTFQDPEDREEFERAKRTLDTILVNG